jgi:phosphoglycerate dehydrogenase-like enzyme
MGFRLLILDPGDPGKAGEAAGTWPGLIDRAIPDMEIHLTRSPEQAAPLIGEVDAAYGWIDPDLFAEARALKWIQSPQAGPDPSFFHSALVASDVVVTNMAGIFSDHIAAHIMAHLLGFARGLPTYSQRQAARDWRPGAPTVYLPESRALIVGVGAIGAETARLCAAFGITVTGIDARLTDPPEGVETMLPPDALDDALGAADFVILTVPETPATQRFFNAAKFAAMKDTAFFINIGRGATVVLDDLDAALRARTIAGAALDVFEIEPLPKDHPLWDAPGMVINPHVAATGPYLDDRRTEVFLDNCRRFDASEPLRNVVDKANWF